MIIFIIVIIFISISLNHCVGCSKELIEMVLLRTHNIYLDEKEDFSFDDVSYNSLVIGFVLSLKFCDMYLILFCTKMRIK